MSFFWIKLFFLKKKKEKTRTTNNYKKCGHPFVQQCLLKLYKISRQTEKIWRSGNMAIYDFHLFRFQFAIKILPTFFNLARSTCSFYWCYIFFFFFEYS